MKSIEERAIEYSLKDFDGYYTGREKAVEEGYIAGATEQKDKMIQNYLSSNLCGEMKHKLIAGATVKDTETLLKRLVSGLKKMLNVVCTHRVPMDLQIDLEKQCWRNSYEEERR